MSQITPQGNFITDTTSDAIGLLHEIVDLVFPPVIDSLLPGAATQPSNQPATCAPSQLGQPSASCPPVVSFVTWIPQFQTTCQPNQQACHDLAALWEIVKALAAQNRELVSRINLLQESIRQLSQKQYDQGANNTSSPNNMPIVNISPEIGNNAGVGNNSGVISSGDGNVQGAGKTDYGQSGWAAGGNKA